MTTIRWPASGGGSGSGITKVANEAARLALSPTDGDVVIQLDTDELWQYNSSSWGLVNSAPTGSAGGDLSGTYPDPTVATVGGETAANLAQGAQDALAATDANSASKIVKRDASGNFSAGTITADLTGTATDTENVGSKTAAEVEQAVDDSQAATAANTPSTIVKRDGAGNIAFEQATGDLTGTASGNVAKTGDTMSGELKADGGIDVTSTAGDDILNIGQNNADIINLGRVGAQINMYGDVVKQNVTDSEVTDKNITVNKDGAAASGNDSGIEVEENGSITAYAKVGNSRNSWDLKAPNTAGVARITPGASGITLDQSSHDPLTIGSNANGLSLNGQELEMDVADTDTTGALSSTDWNTFNNKVSAGGSIDTHSDVDVTTTTPVEGSALRHDGSSWVTGLVKEAVNFNDNPNFLHGKGTLTDSGTGTTLSQTTTSTEIPLYPQRKTAIKVLFGSSGTGHSQIARFTVPDTLGSHLLAIDWIQKVGSAYATGNAKVELYVYANSDYSDGSPVEVALYQDDDSGDTYLAAANGRTQIEFLADSSSFYYELRATRVSGGGTANDWIAFNEVRPTYDKAVSGPAVGSEEDISLSFTNDSNISATVTAKAQQVGETMLLRLLYVPGGDGTDSGNFGFQLPAGYTPNLTPFEIAGLGYMRVEGATDTFEPVSAEWDGTNFNIRITNGGTNVLVGGNEVGTSSGKYSKIAFPTLRIPITEWAGQGVTNYISDNIIYANYKSRHTTNAAQEFTTGSIDTVVFEDLDYESHSAYNTSTGVFTAPVAGKYRFAARVTLNASPTGAQTIFFYKNDTLVSRKTLNTDGGTNTVELEDTLDLAAGDEVEVRYQQNDGTFSLSTSTGYNVLAIEKVAEYSAGQAVAMPRYQTTTVALASSGSFDASCPAITLTRIGNVVTITSAGALTHASSSSVSSAAGVIPADYLPSNDVAVTTDSYSGGISRLEIDSDGTVTIAYRNYDGTARNAPSSRVAVSISYVVT